MLCQWPGNYRYETKTQSITAICSLIIFQLFLFVNGFSIYSCKHTCACFAMPRKVFYTLCLIGLLILRTSK